MDQFVTTLFLSFFVCGGSSDGGFMNKLENMRKQMGQDTRLQHNTVLESLVYKNETKNFVHATIEILQFNNDKFEDNDDISDVTQHVLRRRRRSANEQTPPIHITPQFWGDYPFTSVVLLQNGCSGMLIWTQHVLTSAHCVHDQEKFKQPVQKLKVGLVNTDKTFTWFGASKIFIPPKWLKKKDLESLNHDYAVIKLDKPHGRRWMPFGTYDDPKENKIFQFAGFPADKDVKQMWFSFCSVSRTLSLKHVFLNKCPAAPGMSGSGVYVINDMQQRKLVAVMSSYVKYKEVDGKNHFQFKVNVATRLTKGKVNRICKWLQAGDNCYKLRLTKYHRRSRDS